MSKPTPFIKAQKAVDAIEKRFADRLIINSDLTRSVVSFQANRAEPIFRWFKYREGFSKSLIEYLLNSIRASHGDYLLDPFSGTGATCFVGSVYGLNCIGIELLPVGAFFTRARIRLRDVPNNQIIEWATFIRDKKPWDDSSIRWTYPHLRITKQAFPERTEQSLNQYRSWALSLKEPLRTFADLLSVSVLEEISYTRKDGQYLRWDSRSPRDKSAGEFNKGVILSFDVALNNKCNQVIADLSETSLSLFPIDLPRASRGSVKLLEGSNYDCLDKIRARSINYVITSPPYCNRYDYTRTYALELAYLGVGESQIRDLRQELLTCTVEHKSKNFKGRVSPLVLRDAHKAFNNAKALQACLAFLRDEREANRLNNKGIATMVEGYFFDMAVHLRQVRDKMKRGGKYIMVNDNVRYNGLNIPVDCLLSDLAESLGFICEKIWVLPLGKGNSSQQMARHGREELRKCVYVWSRK